VTVEEGRTNDWQALFEELVRERRASALHPHVSVPPAVAGGCSEGNANAGDPPANAGGNDLWVAAERLNQLRAIHPQASLTPQIDPPASYANQTWTFEDAVVEIMRGRLDGLGPVTVTELAESFSLRANQIEI